MAQSSGPAQPGRVLAAARAALPAGSVVVCAEGGRALGWPAAWVAARVLNVRPAKVEGFLVDLAQLERGPAGVGLGAGRLYGLPLDAVRLVR